MCLKCYVDKHAPQLIVTNTAQGNCIDLALQVGGCVMMMMVHLL